MRALIELGSSVYMEQRICNKMCLSLEVVQMLPAIIGRWRVASRKLIVSVNGEISSIYPGIVEESAAGLI